MICPQCNVEMHDISYKQQSIARWGCDDPHEYVEKYICGCCAIVYKKNDFAHSGEYIIPKGLLATEKQQKTVKFICDQLNINHPTMTKRLAWKFINENLTNAIKQREAAYEKWCENNSDWLPEYY